MNGKIIELYEKLIGDKDLMNDFSGYNDPNELYNFSKQIVDGYSKDEFFEFLGYIVESLNRLDNKKFNLKEIEEKDLDSVSGGKMSLFYRNNKLLFRTVPALKRKI